MEAVCKYTKEELDNGFEKLWRIYPQGNESMTRKRYEEVINEQNLTIEFLYDAYDKYESVKSKLNAGKFTAKEDKLKSIYDFLNTGMYNISYATQTPRNDARDRYLYHV